MKLCDLHVDTPTKLYDRHLSYTDPAREVFSDIHRVYAIFSRPSLSDDEAFSAFFAIKDRFRSAISPYLSSNYRATLAVEDARLLAGDLDRLTVLYREGVRILTLCWRGVTCIGGAHDTGTGLSAFGKEALLACFRLGILPDLSHASDATFSEVAERSAERNAPLLATHSNSRTQCQHRRNLTDEQFESIRSSGGLCGLSLCPEHLNTAGCATSRDLLRHLEHFLSLGGENTVALGTDFDGIDTTPTDLPDSCALATLQNEMARLGYHDSLIRHLFYENAETFLAKQIKNIKL